MVYLAPFPGPEHYGGHGPNPTHVLQCMCCCCYNYIMTYKDQLPCMRKAPMSICKGYCSKIDEHLESIKPVKHPQAADTDTWYTFTLTIPTGSTPFKDLTEVARNIMLFGSTNKPYEKPSQYAYVLEHTEKGTPHVHGMYKTPSGRRIASKYFQRHHTIKEWVKTDADKFFWNEKIHLGHGHRGGYHQKARQTECYEGYLEKEGVVIKSKAPNMGPPITT